MRSVAARRPHGLQDSAARGILRRNRRFIVLSLMPRHAAADLIRLFDAEFAASHNTVLVRGNAEPIYLPADTVDPRHRIVFAHGFFASALHEIAHWCLAGARRRKLVDYGYWYAPDGRDAEQQAEFEAVEAKPQAIEWGLHIAAGSRFRVSVDNLSGIPVDREGFSRQVYRELEGFAKRGFPDRAQRFIDVLCGFYGQTWRLPENAHEAA